jgi:DNA-binding FadR family transcriptional regulator
VPDDQPIEPFDPAAVTADYVWRAVADHVIARIKAGQLAPGARLEGEREMSSTYGVALGTVRRARKALADEGWIRILPAKGVFVTPEDQWPDDTQQ